MTQTLACFRCGASLASLSLPIDRRDECPDCAIHLHVCKMCVFYDPDVAKQCREDDAEEVFDKEKVNFCEWYEPTTDAYDPVTAGQAEKARSELAALFGEETNRQTEPDAQLKDAEDLFK